ncbi:MAG TPA: SGNH/GDSL hydrolase family protein [Fimbriimonadaceae bacterium]|nr:SGNH/GDSL hydrolase family protein [Fimbriimonadaceae bacterium]
MLATLVAMSSFALHSGDRVCFYGDSITEQQLYTVYVEAFVHLRFPKLKVDFSNRGWSGDTAAGQTEGGPAELRVKRDVAPVKATVVTIMLGMNDGGYVPFEEKRYSAFEASYNKLCDLLAAASAPGARFTMIETSPWDDYTRDDPTGYNGTLMKYAPVVKEAAAKRGALFVDFNAPMAKVMTEAKKKDVKLANQIVPDWIHPGVPGHIMMAGELLKAWGAPAEVCDVRLDAAAKQVSKSDNATVTGFDGLTWTELDAATPFAADPDDPAVKLVLSLYDFQDALNRETLEVDGLAQGTYRLTIDGVAVGSFSGEELGKGINLANYDTPMRKQAVQVVDWAWKRSHVDFARWREVDFQYADRSAGKAASKAMEKLERDVLNDELKAAQPVSHRYRLEKLS